MRRDTPRDELPAAPERAEPADALQALGMGQTLEAAYGIWEDLRREHAGRRLAIAQEEHRLESEGRFLLGAVRAAGHLPPGQALAAAPADHARLVPTDPSSLETFLHEAESRLLEARASLRSRAESEEHSFQTALEGLERGVEERVRRYASQAPPSLLLWRRPVGADRAVLHLKSVSADTAVVLLHLATGRIAFRYEFLADDTTDAPDRNPPPFYGMEGALGEDLRPSPRRFPERVRPAGRVSPVKGFLPIFVAGPGRDFLPLPPAGPGPGSGDPRR